MLLFISERREYKNTHRDLLMWAKELQEGQTVCGDWFLKGRWEGVGRAGNGNRRGQKWKECFVSNCIFVNVCY